HRDRFRGSGNDVELERDRTRPVQQRGPECQRQDPLVEKRHRVVRLVVRNVLGAARLHVFVQEPEAVDEIEDVGPCIEVRHQLLWRLPDVPGMETAIDVVDEVLANDFRTHGSPLCWCDTRLDWPLYRSSRPSQAALARMMPAPEK